MSDKTTKLALVGGGIIFAVIVCNLSASGLTNSTAQSLSTIAMAQAMSEQAQANQEMAQAVQSVAHSMNLILIVVLLLAFLGAGLYVWHSYLTIATTSTPKTPALASAEPPLRVVYMPRPQLPENLDEAFVGELSEQQAAELWHALTSGEEWQR